MYYKIKDSLKRKEVGRFPQCEKTLWDGQRFDEDSFAHNGKIGPLTGNPALPLPILHKSAKPTDLISVTSFNGILYKIITNDFYGFLNSVIRKHQKWEIKISNDVYKFDRKKAEYILNKNIQQEFYDYIILHVSYPKENFIAFEKSEFFLDSRDSYHQHIGLSGIPTSYMLNLKESIAITSNNHYRQLIQELRQKELPKKVIIPRKLVFNLSENKDEIFRVITPINNLSGYYVSENLKNKIQEQGFTGMDFKPLDELNPHIDIEIR